MLLDVWAGCSDCSLSVLCSAMWAHSGSIKHVKVVQRRSVQDPVYQKLRDSHHRA